MYPCQWQADQAQKLFRRCGIPVKRLTQIDAVNFVTMDSSKGPEFPLVAVAELPDVGGGEENQEEVGLAYVAMTRATEALVGLNA